MFTAALRFVMVLVLLALSGTTLAAPQPPQAPAPPNGGTGQPDARRAVRNAPAVPKAEELEALVIEGKVTKPEVFYVLGRAEHRYQGLFVRKSFVDEVVRSVTSPIF